MLKNYKKTMSILLLIVISICLLSCQENQTSSNSFSINKQDITQMNKIVFLGDSITANCDFNELYENNYNTLVNMGVCGDSTYNILKRIDSVANQNPNKLFLLIGINDLLGDYISFNQSIKNYESIINILKQQNPDCEIYVESILPINEKNFPNKNSKIEQYNNQISLLAQKYNLVYIDLYNSFFENNRLISKAYLGDGLHLTKQGYKIIKNIQEKYIKSKID